ncbi:MAG: PAS domain S-box protein [Thaumarchaeota archaeon]|nr:PAS domain S-box protein [Nitrososphaerota archaeon]MDE1817724.1 PAS domain S-box protein [Nitrososphaerota archaeon]MDE1876203.1 PAS domain S-box protein [Nitrososphaerota archaeon]
MSTNKNESYEYKEEDLNILLERYETMSEKYRNLYDSSPDLYRTINIDGIILDCNKTYATKLGYTKEEIVGKTIFEHVAENSQKLLQDAYNTWKTVGVVSGREIWLRRKDQTIFPVLLSATNLYDKNGMMIGSNTTIKDMTEIHNAKKEIEEHKLKNLNVIGDLSARISHDFRNPISIIRNSLELMKIQNQDLSEKNKDHILMMERAIARISHQLEEVLDYVLPRPLDLKTHPLSAILEAAISKIDFGEIVLNIPKEDHIIVCDGAKIEIVFTNLILNAVQAMGKKGNIFVKINDGIDFITIEVEDSGPGIPKHLIEKMFEPLFTTRQIGTGLGLVSCKSIIEKHNGTIDIRTQIGKGTTFTIKLPKLKPTNT